MNLPGLAYDSPKVFSRRQRILMTILPPVIATGIRVLLRPAALEVRHEEHFTDTLSKHGKAILGGWHENILFGACRYRGTNFHAIASESFDGEIAVRVMRQLGMNAVRGSSSNGPTTVLRRLIKAVELADVVGLAVDGPRGPRRIAKPGIAILASRTGIPIIPNAFAVSHGWCLNSWDRMLIPKPFSKMVCLYGEPIPAPPKGSKSAIAETTLDLESRLNELQDSLEEEFPKVRCAKQENAD